MTKDMASGRDSDPEIDDDGPTLKADLSDLFASRTAAPRPVPAEKALFDQQPAESGTASGLIDIRSLASTYNAEKGIGEVDEKAADEPELPKIPLAAPEPEPIFEGAQVLPAGTSDRASLRRTLMIFGGIAAAAVAMTAVVTALIVRASLGGPGTDDQAAAVAVVPEETPAVAPDEPEETFEEHDLAAFAAEETAEEELGETAEPAEANPAEAAAAESERRDRTASSERRSAARERDDDDEIIELQPLAAPAPPAPAETPAPSAPEPAKPAAPAEEYDVDCLLNPNRAGCGRDESKPAAASAPAEKLPEYLQRGDIEAGLAPFRGRLRTCAELHDVRGVANLAVTVSADGNVTRVDVGAGDAEFQGCVRALVRQARFARTRSGHTFRYPLVLR